jgi:tRNA(Ile)-lysidine synthase
MDRNAVRPDTVWPAFLRQIESAIHARGLLPDNRKILVAVSGGLDSMVLVHALRDLAATHRWALTIAHFNHQLRGSASDSDERLLRKTARALKLPLVAGRVNIRKAARQAGISIEMAARDRRHGFLARTAHRLRIPIVALAHQADDQVELFFLRLLRGTGSLGLAGMKWASPSPSDPSVLLVRPLLRHSKAELATAARAHGIAFSEDETNASLEFERNRVRHELIPLLREKYQPALMETVPRLMELAGAEAEVVTAVANAWWRTGKWIEFGRLAVAVQRRVIQLQLFQLGQTPDFELVEQLRAAPDEPFAINQTQTLCRDTGGLLHLRKIQAVKFDPARRRVVLRGGKGRAGLDGLNVKWEIETVSGAQFTRRANVEYFDADKVGAAIWLRYWQPGDRFQPIGCGSSRKLQDLFVNMKVPRDQRRARVVAETSQEEIFWVEGLRLAEKFKLKPGTVRRLKWQWRRGATGGARAQLLRTARATSARMS